MTRGPIAARLAPLARQLQRVRPRRDIDGWPRSEYILASYRGADVALWVASDSPVQADVQRVYAAICAAMAGLDRQDREVRTVDLGDEPSYEAQYDTAEQIVLPLIGGPRDCA